MARPKRVAEGTGPPDVFASYAQRDFDKHMQRFVDELRRELSIRLGPTGAVDVVFLDRDGLTAGDVWSPKIVERVRTARALVCLMSPTYLTREWCGRELQVFLERQKALGSDDPPFIFPVWWQPPVTPRPLPRSLAALNYRDGGFPPAYEANGIRGLARRGLWLQFSRMVDRLVELIGASLDASCVQLPPGTPVVDVLAIANAFDEVQPGDVLLVTFARDGDRWVPSRADLSVSAAAETTARRLQTVIRPLSGAELADPARLDRSVAEDQVLLVVADASTPPDAEAVRIDRHKLPNLAVLLVVPQPASTIDDGWLALDGSFGAARARGLVRTATIGGMQAEMERLVDETRRRLSAQAPTSAVRDEALARAAEAHGISVELPPSLSGPGGGRNP